MGDFPALAAQLNLSMAALIAQADQHTLAVQTWLASRAPAAAVLHTENLCAASTGLGVRLLNLALGANYPANTPPAVILAGVQQVHQFFSQRGVLWYWWLGPTTQPPDFDNALTASGLIFNPPGPPGLPTMIAPLQSDHAYPPVPAPMRVWQAENTADLQHASTIRRLAFRFPNGVGHSYFEDMPESWLGGRGVRLFLAAPPRSTTPAAIGALIVRNNVPGVYIMATHPNHARLGLGKAILTAILQQARTDGHPFIVLTASRMGLPLYQQFGFVLAYHYRLYRLPD